MSFLNMSISSTFILTLDKIIVLRLFFIFILVAVVGFAKGKKLSFVFFLESDRKFCRASNEIDFLISVSSDLLLSCY